MLILIVILTLLGLLNIGLDETDRSAEVKNPELEKMFREKSAKIAAKRKKKMQRYNPSLIEETKFSTDTKAGIGSEQPASAPMPPDTSTSDKEALTKSIDVNQADQQTLERLPGIGPTYARRIIRYREQKGLFKTPEELKKIKGIGPKRLEQLMPYLDLSTFNNSGNDEE